MKGPSMTSRDPNLLYTPLRIRWEWLKAGFMKEYPLEPEPRLSCVTRGKEDQEKAFSSGKSHAHFGESLHNYSPSMAFDVFFNDDKDTPVDKSDDVADWNPINFTRFGNMAKNLGLVWGGDWAGLVDAAHIQMPMTWQEVRDGKKPPTLPSLVTLTTKGNEAIPLPEDVTLALSPWEIVVMVGGKPTWMSDITSQESVVTRVDFGKKRYYIDIKERAGGV